VPFLDLIYRLYRMARIAFIASRLPLVVDRDGKDAADLWLKFPVPDDPRFGGGRQHWRAR
jgi:hypothetical protein